MPTNVELARQVFDAAERADTAALRSLCAPTFSLSQNGGAPLDFEAFIGFSTTIVNFVTNPHYENIVTRETSDGFVEEHDFCAALPDGTKIRAPACVVATIADGRIVSAREYFDPAAIAKLAAALQG